MPCREDSVRPSSRLEKKRISRGKSALRTNRKATAKGDGMFHLAKFPPAPRPAWENCNPIGNPARRNNRKAMGDGRRPPAYLIGSGAYRE